MMGVERPARSLQEAHSYVTGKGAGSHFPPYTVPRPEDGMSNWFRGSARAPLGQAACVGIMVGAALLMTERSPIAQQPPAAAPVCQPAGAPARGGQAGGGRAAQATGGQGAQAPAGQGAPQAG